MGSLRGVLVVAAVLVPVLVAIWWTGSRAGSERVDGPWNRPLAERVAMPFPRTFRNSAGDVVELAAPAARIVSGTVFSDAVLLEACPHDRILALHALSSDPRYSPVAAESSAFPRHVAGEAEEILALRPDLVVISTFSRKEIRSLLTAQGCAVLRFSGFESIEDIESNIRALGWAIGRDAAVESLVAGMEATLGRLAASRASRTGWRVLHLNGGFTSGSATTFDSLLRRLGARNAARELGVVESEAIRPEEVLLLDPDALVVGTEPGDEADAAAGLRLLPGFGSLRALRDGHVIAVPAALLSSTSHHIVEAAERIATALDRWGPR